MKTQRIVIAIVLTVAGAGAGAVLRRPAAPVPPAKIEGIVYPLHREFLVSLDDGRYAKVSVALVLEEGAIPETEGAPAEAGEGYGPLPQEAVVRGIVTDALTGSSATALNSRERRERLKRRLRRSIAKATDVPVLEVLIPDVTVQ